jgi:hypothetical protein
MHTWRRLLVKIVLHPRRHLLSPPLQQGVRAHHLASGATRLKRPLRVPDLPA